MEEEWVVDVVWCGVVLEKKKRHHELNTKIIQGTTDTNTSNTNKDRERENGWAREMQIYWWAYDYQLEIFQSINFPNQWKSAYIWRTIPLLTVIFGLKQLSSVAQSQMTHTRSAYRHQKHAQPASQAVSKSVNHHIQQIHRKNYDYDTILGNGHRYFGER